MTRETKVGLLMVTLLVGVFGFMVYKKMHRPAEALAEQNTEAVVISEANDEQPFGNDTAFRGEQSLAENRVMTAAAAAPAKLPDQSPASRSGQHEVDPFLTETVVSSEAKPKRPTTIPEDDAFLDSVPNQATTVRQREAGVTASPPAATFDPFMEEAKPSASTNAIPERGNSSVAASDTSAPTGAAEADPFEAPLEVVQSAPPVVTAPPAAAPPLAASPLTEVDPFEPAPAATTKAEPLPELSPPPRKPASLPTEEFDIVEQPQPRTPTLSAPAPTVADLKPTPQPVATTSVPSDDERLGGFRPVEVTKRAMNEFAREERISTPAIPASDLFDAARRPAPATRIDEDFAPRTATRPLVPGDTYNIEPNDNYWTISRKKYGTGRYFMALSQHNLSVIPDPKRMKPGVTIATPAAETLEKTYPTLIPKAAPAETTSSAETVASPTGIRRTNATTGEEAGFFIASDGTPMYRVGNEDTLSDIAKQHLGRSSRWVQIFEMNRDTLTDGNSLKVGSLLRLPGDASRVDVVGSPRVVR